MMIREWHVLTFSARGEKIAAKMAERLEIDTSDHVFVERVRNLNDATRRAFRKGNVLVFVGAAGIAVRAIAPLLKSKTDDPAVLVVDELGRFVIPILSGHVGGANAAAKQIAEYIAAMPVITTATDINGVFAVDVFAVERRYHIVNPDAIKHVSAVLLEGETIGLVSDFEIVGNLPEHVALNVAANVGICIGLANHAAFDTTLQLVPKRYHIGIGAKKDAPFDALHAFFADTLRELQLPCECVASIASIDLKRNEAAIVALAATCRVPFDTYSAEQMAPHESRFDASEFVRNATGVGNVCEIAAWLAAKQGRIIAPKRSRDGITLAVACEEHCVRFGGGKHEN